MIGLFSFSKEELNAMFTIVLQKYHYSYEFGEFLDHFFGNIDELNDFVKEHEQQFENYVNEKDYSISYKLEDCDNFVALILNGNHSKLVNHIENYSVTNLKLLVQYINRGNEIQYYQGNERFARHLFEVKSELDFNEFSILLSLLKEKVCYNVIEYGMEEPLFPTLVKENIDYLIEVVSKSNIMPMCLAESTFFRDECIRRNRIDLAVKCILPPDIFQNEELINAYCKELNS